MQSLQAVKSCRHHVTPTNTSSPQGCRSQAAWPAASSQWRHALPAAKGPGSLALTWQRRHKPDCSSARWPGQVCAAAASPDGGGLGLVGLMASLMQQAQQQVGPARSQAAGAGVLTQGATLDVASLHYHPAGGHFPVSADMARLSGPCRLLASQRSIHCTRSALGMPAARLHMHRPGTFSLRACSQHSFCRPGSSSSHRAAAPCTQQLTQMALSHASPSYWPPQALSSRCCRTCPYICQPISWASSMGARGLARPPSCS